MFSYDQTVRPPAPLLPVLVSGSQESVPLGVRVIVDSGSSVTALPLSVLKLLKIPAYGYLTVSGYEDQEINVIKLRKWICHCERSEAISFCAEGIASSLRSSQ